MIEVDVLVTLQVELAEGGKIHPAVARRAAGLAVTAAMKRAENDGFEHRYADSVCIGFVEAK